MMQKLLIIVGPTASGKSALAVELAKKFKGEIISADSRQVYKGLDIGTGKITKREMHGVPHYLLDVVSPKKTFTAKDFVIHSTSAVAEIKCMGRLPIVVGGTGFYIDALTGRIHLSDVEPNPKLRSRLEKKSAAQLFAMLKKQDPRRAKTIDQNNTRRLVRALEVASYIGRSSVIQRTDLCNYDCLWVGITPKPEELRKNIQLRIKGWMRRGLIEEVRRLRKSRISWKRLSEFGFEYSLVAEYLRGRLTKKGLAERMESATWRYARRQIGYWRRNHDIKWFAPKDAKKISILVHQWLKD